MASSIGWIQALGLGAWLIFASSAPAQDGSPSRIEREANGQGSQADRLLKGGQYAAALRLYQAERASRKAIGDTRYEAFALRNVGVCLARLGDDEGAVAAFAETRTLDATRADKGFEGYDGLLMAQAQMRLSRPADALESLTRALPKLDQAVDRDHECDARLCLVAALLDLDDPEKASPHADRSLALAEELNDPRRLADAWLATGLVARETGRIRLAFERIDDAFSAYREQDRPADAARAGRQLADLSYRLGHPDRAARRFEQAALAHAKLGDKAAEAEDRLDLASVRLDLGQVDASAEQAALARDGFLEVNDEGKVIDALVVLAQAQSRLKEGLNAAAATLDDAIGRAGKALREAPAERVRLLLLSAELEHRLGRSANTTARIDAAAEVARTQRDDALRAAVEAAKARLVVRP